MKKESRKLSLNRETLAPMQSEELANVNGGLAPTIITGAVSITTRSSQVCISAAGASVASLIEAASQAVTKSRWCGPK